MFEQLNPEGFFLVVARCSCTEPGAYAGHYGQIKEGVEILKKVAE